MYDYISPFIFDQTSGLSNYVGVAKKTLFLHIGTQKTGTTTIQSILSKNKEKLLSEGIGYLGRFAKLAREIRVIEEYDEKLVNQLQEEINTEIDAIKNRDLHTFVISNEKFSGDKMISHRNAGAIAHFLKEVFDPFNFDIKIIVFLRRQDQYIESTYVQKVYSGSTDSFQEFLDHFNEMDFHWDEFLDLYANVFGVENMFVRGFDKKYLPHEDSLIQTFGTIIGSTFLQDYSGKVVRNEGFSRNALEIMRIANKDFKITEKRQLREILRESDLGGGKPIFFNNSDRQRFLANYNESNRQVTSQYFKNQTDPLFSIPKYPPECEEIKFESLTLETAVVSLAKSILALNDKLKKCQRNATKPTKVRNLLSSIRLRF